MSLINIKCSFCGAKFSKPRSRYNESLKFGWRLFCSKNCLGLSKILSLAKKCGNDKCKKEVVCTPRRLKTTSSGKVFCSHRCRAIVINSERQSKYKTVVCRREKCLNQIPENRKYCSRECASMARSKIIDQVREEVSSTITEFYNIQQRIPVKREMYGMYKKARRAFGSWNNAIKLAGLTPNPVMFSKRCLALDGHWCDSMSEKIIDDWLFENKIEHKTHVPYPMAKDLSCDFVIGEYFVEFFGLDGYHERYTELARKKRALAVDYKVNLIELIPKDILPRNKLAEKLGFLIAR